MKRESQEQGLYNFIIKRTIVIILIGGISFIALTLWSNTNRVHRKTTSKPGKVRYGKSVVYCDGTRVKCIEADGTHYIGFQHWSDEALRELEAGRIHKYNCIIYDKMLFEKEKE